MDSLPILLNEDQAVFFKFWHEGNLCEGLRWQQELFGCLQVFPFGAREKAYELGCLLAEQNVQVVITSGRDRGYSVWGNLKASGPLTFCSFSPGSANAGKTARPAPQRNASAKKSAPTFRKLKMAVSPAERLVLH